MAAAAAATAAKQSSPTLEELMAQADAAYRALNSAEDIREKFIANLKSFQRNSEQMTPEIEKFILQFAIAALASIGVFVLGFAALTIWSWLYNV